MFPYTHAYSNWLIAAFSLVTSLLKSVKRPLMATNTNFNKFRVAKSENCPFLKFIFGSPLGWKHLCTLFFLLGQQKNITKNIFEQKVASGDFNFCSSWEKANVLIFKYIFPQCWILNYTVELFMKNENICIYFLDLKDNRAVWACLRSFSYKPVSMAEISLANHWRSD